MCTSCRKGIPQLFVGCVMVTAKEAFTKILTLWEMLLWFSSANPEAPQRGYLCVKAVGARDFLITPMLVGEGETDSELVDACLTEVKRLERSYNKHGRVLSFHEYTDDSTPHACAIIGTDCRGQKTVFCFAGLPKAANFAILLCLAFRLNYLTESTMKSVSDKFKRYYLKERNRKKA